jgi:hypothetical protein
VYNYNWSGDTNSSFEKQITALVNWHNARWHLLSWIICQKSGLFDHSTFCDMPGEVFISINLFVLLSKLLSCQQESPQPVQSMSDIDNLVKFTSPPPVNQVSRSRHRSGNLSQRISIQYPLAPGTNLHPGIPLQSPAFILGRLYQDLKPPSAMHHSPYAKMKDPVHKHGAQFMEMRTLERRGIEVIMSF